MEKKRKVFCFAGSPFSTMKQVIEADSGPSEQLIKEIKGFFQTQKHPTTRPSSAAAS